MAGIGHWYIEMEKQAYWRGLNKTFINRYIMSGADPAQADANEVIDSLNAIENNLFPVIGAGQGVGFVQARAYKSTGGPPLLVVNYNESKNLATATGFSGPTGGYESIAFTGTLENALLVSMPLQGLSTRGKPVSVKKFFRGIINQNEAGQDAGVSPSDVAKINANVTPWATGMGTNQYVVIGKSGRQSSGHPTAHVFIANHQVPRGKKRPKV